MQISSTSAPGKTVALGLAARFSRFIRILKRPNTLETNGDFPI
jgi:hypothetical protein